MNALLISANTERGALTTLPRGLACVAAATRAAGHAVTVLDLLFREELAEAVAQAVLAAQPDVIGVSVRNVDDQAMAAPRFLLEPVRAVVAACRAASAAPVVLGGAGFSIFPLAALRYLGADWGIAGEGEVAFPALLAALGRGETAPRVPGLVAPSGLLRPPRRHLAALGPAPAPGDLLGALPPAQLAETWVPVQTRRGCDRRCAYCSTPVIEGRRSRARPVDDVLSELRGLAAVGARRVYFVDNTFNRPAPYARALCDALAGADADLGLRWRCIIYPRGLDAGLARAMAAAGCEEVALGFESGAPSVLRALGKDFGPDDVRRTAAHLGAAGIRRTGFLLLGGPGETRATVRESLDFVASLGLEAHKVTVGLRIYPGTPLWRAAIRDGVVAADDDLLPPRFYLAAGLAGWLDDVVAAHRAAHAECLP